MCRLPNFLKQGDTVAIVSPSGPINKSYIDSATAILKSWGLTVLVGTHACSSYGVFAGTDEQRATDFQEALDNPNVRAVFCSRGGYGAIRIVEQLDYSKFLQSPKWIVGFSDITVFHAKLASLGVASLHAAMPKNFGTVSKESLESLHSTLFGTLQSISWQSSPFNINGTVRGTLIGGNLSLLYSMRGVPFEYTYSNALLFFEDLQEYLYHIDRIMQNFKYSGLLSNIQGLLVGGMTGMKHGVDQYNASIETIIRDAVAPYSIPLCFNVPSGHDSENMALILGHEYECIIETQSVLLHPIQPTI
ncbi:MAG TPA: LD-carboxypeptidase [Bacteroidales bacterium]|nr:LD-carboxypeptidase [Bacteroidales bacterium]